MTHRTYEIVRGTVLLAIALSILGWFLVRCLKRSEDPARLLFKYMLTAGVIAGMLIGVAPLVAKGGYAAAFVGIPMTAVCGLFLTFIWGAISEA